MNILAIDLGKFNSMCCFFDTTTQAHRFQAAATTRSYLTAVLNNHWGQKGGRSSGLIAY